MPSRTTYLARLIGLYCILAALFLAAHKQATVEMVTALLHSQALLFVTGLFAMSSGLALVLGHNSWSGGALPVVVTLVGWTILIKGLLFLFLSPHAASALFLGSLHYKQFFYGYTGITLVLGVCLAFLSRRRPPST